MSITFFLLKDGTMESGEVHTRWQSFTKSNLRMSLTMLVSVMFTTTVLFHLLVPTRAISSVVASIVLT